MELEQLLMQLMFLAFLMRSCGTVLRVVGLEEKGAAAAGDLGLHRGTWPGRTSPWANGN